MVCLMAFTEEYRSEPVMIRSSAAVAVSAMEFCQELVANGIDLRQVVMSAEFTSCGSLSCDRIVFSARKKTPSEK